MNVAARRTTFTAAIASMLFALASQADELNYEEHIKPLLREHCLKCHNTDQAEADLDLSSFAATLKGGSSGAVVKPGLPESSQLYRAIAHLDGAEAMPPESPRLSDKKLALVRGWIRGGLVAGKGGKSQLRSIAAVLTSAAQMSQALMPESLPPIEQAETVRAPIPQAMAVCPGAPLFAVSGHEQVLLYGGSSTPADDFSPVARDDIVRHWAFDGDEGNAAGQVGGARAFNRDSTPLRIDTNVDFSRFTELTLSLWIRPTEGENNPTVFGQQHGLTLFLERHRDGWKPRLFLRDQDNAISYYGRTGVLPNDKWSHLAAVWKGTTWTWFIDGRHIVDQKCPATMRRIQQREAAVQAVGGTLSASGQVQNAFSGAVDELRIYRRALSAEEVRAAMREASETAAYKLLGALPFPEGTICDVKFSRNGSLLLAAGGRGAHSGRVVLFDLKTGRRVAEIGDEVDSVLAADLSRDHQYVVLGSPSKIVKVFSTKSGELVHRIKKHTDWITAAAFSPDGKMVATGDRSGGVHVWETEKGAIVYTLDEHKVRITDIGWRADGTIVATAAEDGNLILWSMKDGFPLRNVLAHANRRSPRYSRRTGVLSLDFAPDGRLLTCGRDGLMRLWSADGSKQMEFRIDSRLPVSALFLGGGSAAVVGCFDGTLRIFDLAAKSQAQLLSTGKVGGMGK